MSKEINQILKKLKELGPIMPGKISEQYNVCKTPNCICKRKDNPQKHGPYYYLSFTFNGKGRTLSVPEDKVDEITNRNENYKEFKTLTNELVQLSIQLTKDEVLHAKTKSKSNKNIK